MKRFSSLSALVALFVVMCSCESIYFSVPQPIDAKNLDKFPGGFRGFYRNEGEGDTVMINGTSYMSISYEPRKIVISTKKVLRRTSRYGIEVNSNDTVQSRQTGQPTYFYEIDTAASFIIRQNKVYEISNGGLSEECPFKILGDTMYYSTKKVGSMQLGEKMILRKISGTRYLMNVNIDKTDQFKQWWSVALIQKNQDGSIDVFSLSDKFQDPDHKIYSASGNTYFDSRWTKKDVEKLIAQGVFSDKVFKLLPMKK